MFDLFTPRDHSKAGFWLGRVLCWKRSVLFTVLLATLLLLQIVSVPIVWALPNSLQDAGFESGSLNYGWHKWGYPISIVGVQNTDNHTANGSWSGYIIPNGRYVELQQNLAVSWGNQYHLQAYVKTNGMTAQLGWWSTTDGPHNCGNPVNSTTWVKVSCNFTPSQSTDFNVHLGGSSPSGSAAMDDVQLFRVADGGGYNHLHVELRHDLNSITTARDYKTSIWVNALPTNYTGNRIVSDWLAVYTPRFFQVGFRAASGGVQWFIETVDIGQGHLIITCAQGTSAKNGQECYGDFGSRAGLGRWQDVELVTYGQGFWVIRVYDEFGQALDMATINDTSLTIADAYVTGEESWNWDINNPDTQEDQYIRPMEFYNSHPKYMVWGTGFVEWDAGGSNVWVDPGNYTICPAPYGVTINLNNDNRFWFDGSGGWVCSVMPIF